MSDLLPDELSEALSEALLEAQQEGRSLLERRTDTRDTLHAAEAKLRLIFDLAPIGMALTTIEGEFIEVNRSFCETLGYSQSELLSMRFIDLTHPDDREKNLDLDRQLLSRSISDFRLEKRYLAKDGRVVHALLSAGVVRDQEGNPICLVGQIVDITERVEREEQLRYAAEHDDLTGLSNRARFLQRLRAKLDRLAAGSEAEDLEDPEDPEGPEDPEDPEGPEDSRADGFAVLFMDLDQFKIVNDSMGHGAGNELLVAVAKRLKGAVGPGALLARHSGDEFSVMLDHAEREEALYVANAVHSALAAPFLVRGQDVYTSASIGVVLGDARYSEPEEVLRDADTAMFRAKRRGRGYTIIFDGGMRTEVVSRLTLETELRDAARQRQMCLFYQPIVELGSRRIVGFEALLRWRHPEKGWLSPGSFFHVAEETGYFVEQLPWLLEQACSALVQWNEGREGEGIYVSFNLSRRQLHHPHLVRDIDRALRHSGVRPELLRLELTEMAIAEYHTTTRALLSTLREMGLLLYIDDFGTGYSSLGHIQELPIHALKIDRGFISSWQPGNDRPGIVRAVLSLAEHLEIDVVAEGIETEHQRGRLIELGCPHGQGFLFAEALPVDVCHRLLP